MENNLIKLSTKGTVKSKDKREFTRLVGGFGEDKPMFTIWQAAELLGLRTSKIIENFNNNGDSFEDGVDSIDLKFAVDKNIGMRFLKENGYSQNRLNATKQWLIFSFSGIMKLLYISEKLLQKTWYLL